MYFLQLFFIFFFQLPSFIQSVKCSHKQAQLSINITHIPFDETTIDKDQCYIQLSFFFNYGFIYFSSTLNATEFLIEHLSKFETKKFVLYVNTTTSLIEDNLDIIYICSIDYCDVNFVEKVFKLYPTKFQVQHVYYQLSKELYDKNIESQHTTCFDKICGDEEICQVSADENRFDESKRCLITQGNCHRMNSVGSVYMQRTFVWTSAWKMQKLYSYCNRPVCQSQTEFVDFYDTIKDLLPILFDDDVPNSLDSRANFVFDRYSSIISIAFVLLRYKTK